MAVSFCADAWSLFTLSITTGGSSPIMLNMLKGAAFTVPSAPKVVTSAIGRGTIRLAISL